MGPTSVRVVACRVSVHYVGTGVWTGESASHGITVSAYPAAAPLPLDQETDSPTPVLCGPDARRVELDGLDATMTLGWAGPVDDGLYGIEWQQKVAANFLAWVQWMRLRQAHLFRAREVRLTALTDEDRPTKLYSTTVDLSHPAWAPTSTTTIGPLSTLNVRLDARRRGRRGQGAMYPGPLYSAVSSATGLISPVVSTGAANQVANMLTQLRTQTVPLLPVVACPVVWQRSSPLVSPVWRVRVSDEIVGLSRRQNDRPNQYAVAAL